MNDAATPERAPGDGATLSERADFVTGLLDAERRKAETEEGGTRSAFDDEAGAAEPDRDAAAGDEAPDAEGEGVPEDSSDDDSQDPEERPDANPETFRVKANGAEIEVTRDELLRGYSRTQDYKQKTARLAEERRAVESTRQELQAQRQQLAVAYEAALETASEDAAIIARGSRTDWAKLAEADPIRAQSEWFKFQQARERAVHMLTERQQAAQAQYQAVLQQEAARAAEAIPDYADEGKRSALLTGVRDYLAEVGFSDAELAGLLDHRHLIVARDAMRYRQLVARQKAVAEKKLAEAPRVISPRRAEAAGEEPNLRTLRKRAMETADLRDGANYVLAKLRSR